LKDDRRHSAESEAGNNKKPKAPFGKAGILQYPRASVKAFSRKMMTFLKNAVNVGGTVYSWGMMA